MGSKFVINKLGVFIFTLYLSSSYQPFSDHVPLSQPELF